MTPWYSWAFDGVAGGALVAVGVILYQRYSSKKIGIPPFSSGKNSPVASESPVSANVAGPISDSQLAIGSNIKQSFEVHHHYIEQQEVQRSFVRSAPGPDEVSSALRHTKPFDYHHACESYEGLGVVWELFLGSILLTEHGWMIICYPQSETPMVSFSVSLLLPELKLADRRAMVWVKGRIKRAASGDIELEDDPEILSIGPAKDFEIK